MEIIMGLLKTVLGDFKVVLLGLAFVMAVIASEPGIAQAQTVAEANERVLQVVLNQLPKYSQYDDIDSSNTGYGANACGFVAAAAALGGSNWVSLVDTLAAAAGDTYTPEAGIQPSNYVAALNEVFGVENVQAQNNMTLDDLYQALQDGKIVIVDIKVNSDTQSPSGDAPNYAHFARVLGMDMGTQQLYIENTLHGSAYWTVSFADFTAAWDEPETTATVIPDPFSAENVTNWAVFLTDISNG